MAIRNRYVESYEGATVGPHVDCIRITIENATNYRYIVRYWMMFIERATAAGTPGTVQAKVVYLPAEGGTKVIDVIRMDSNTVGARAGQRVPVEIVMQHGDKLRLITSDDSTGGMNKYMLAAHWTEEV